ncbi:MAG: hypothetical protein CM15mV46_370 [Caudoviricetes sp.]|nr:MAG: hypothetical protein CM15mV46_370 [Caudoviricetes sp.]
MAKAKEIHKTYIRGARKIKFQELDIEFQRAIEKSDSTKQAEVAAKNRH